MSNASPSQTITGLTTIYDPTADGTDKACRGMRVKCLAGSGSAVNVRCSGMHSATEFIRLDPGEHIDFVADKVGMIQVEDAGTDTCLVSHGIFAL